LRQELTRADGLSDVGVAPRRTGLVLSPTRLMSGDGDNRDSLQCRVGFEATGCFITVKPRQLDIHENEVRPMRSRCGKPRLAVFGFDDLEISAREQIPQDLPIVWLILDHQDALAHYCPACASTRTGSVK